MALDMRRAFQERLGELRTTAELFRLRGFQGSHPVVDSRRALLVWEPRRVTPGYAVPRDDVAVPVREVGAPRGLTGAEARRAVLDPSVPFEAHTAPGTVVALDAPGGEVAGFVPDDPDLADHVLVDFAALTWFEADGEAFGHPRDPWHRIDVRPTSAHLRLSWHGTPLVETNRAKQLRETMLPVRWYVPEADVLVPLEPSGTTTWCAYKGRATYRTAVVDGERLEDVLWVYEDPLEDGRDVRGLLGVYAERLDVVVDGEPVR